MLHYQSLRMFRKNNLYMQKSILKYCLVLSLLLPFAGFSQYKNQFDSLTLSHKPVQWKNFVIPTSLVALGIYGTLDSHVLNVKEISEESIEYFPNYSHNADDFLQITPIPAVFLMDAFGFKSVHPWHEQLVYLGRAELIMMGMVYPLKMLTKVPRPDKSANNSFPSGHTAQAFLAAQFFQKEFGRRYPWASVGMYTIASAIGVSRVLNNRHWASDVFAGAGIGMASVELSYLAGIRHHRHSTFQPIVIPSYTNGMAICSMVVGL